MSFGGGAFLLVSGGAAGCTLEFDMKLSRSYGPLLYLTEVAYKR